jgi:UDP-N-acetylglucosamine--N-acetylmuramyl-(pentapeptide) pyrophosphoryl-undecaprenol N-acetylglucosamine transferase
VDQIAVSFKDTQRMLSGRRSFVTGLPVREEIGRCSRAQAAARFGLEPSAPTLAVLGGSQGARAINRLMAQSAQALTDAERSEWQFLHLAGTADESAVREAYAASGARAWVGAHAADMEAVYAVADVAIARSGASTIAELARCGLPSVLIPYPHAGAHQRLNAEMIASKGGGVMIEESEATPEGLLGTLRLLLHDERMRTTMGLRMRELSCDDAAERLSDAILRLAEDTPSGRRSAPALSLRPVGLAR